MGYGDLRDVVHFGFWADLAAERAGLRDALAFVRAALMRCHREDVRGPDLDEATDYLKRHTSRRGGFDALERALAMPDPVRRYEAARAAYDLICRHLGELLRPPG